MIAMNALPYNEDHYASMKKGAEYLLLCQDNGYGGLLCGGKNASGAFYEHCWTSDNSYAYQALKAAQQWARIKNDSSFATQCGMSAEAIIRGINDYLRATLVWHQKIDGNGRPDNGRQYDWINYAPQMLDLPADGVNEPAVGEWICRTF